MNIVHRIPWSAPFGYTEITTEGGLTEEDITNVMYEVAQMEESYRRTYGLPKIGESPVVDEVMRQGGTPVGPNTYTQQAVAPPQANTPQGVPQGPFFCRQCSQPAYIKPNAKPVAKKFPPYNMQYPAECSAQCRNPRNPQYPLTTWVDA